VSQPLIVSLPPNLDLWPGCIIRVTAVSATTGATVSGVNVAKISIEGISDNPEALASGAFVPMLRPG
jgi:hypothetical protein